MCIGPLAPKAPTPPPPPAPPPAPAATSLAASDVEFSALDSDSKNLNKKRKGKKGFRNPLKPKQNSLGTPLSGTGLTIPKTGNTGGKS